MPSDDAPFQVRATTPDDLDALESFIAPFVEDGRILPRTKEELNQLLSTGFLAESNHGIIGFAALEVYSPKLGEIRSLCVAPAAQGMGIGRRLVRECLQLAERRGVFEVMAITSQDEFFKSCGFDFTLPGEKKALFFPVREKH
ncbi:MAG: GNAT family N-acetyltransferase [Planctomycetota bacterium]|nr:MAG: GNAT family N-acetyltransferase [Planctomycetota bacterium]REJ86857.1 MAG: GNAT family N-acetyltransferase [Planctomycetota bacterium]REK22796.1 MAG: GNAT family N-acetyltransferase [Planctomycetota bacterium]REK33784.1 MAG: GNAT family N-acetyltransferase [Planctomycetota bacterium]